MSERPRGENGARHDLMYCRRHGVSLPSVQVAPARSVDETSPAAKTWGGVEGKISGLMISRRCDVGRGKVQLGQLRRKTAI